MRFAENFALPLHTPSDRLDRCRFARRPWIRPWTNEACLLTTPANTNEPSGAIFARGSGASAISVVNGLVPRLRAEQRELERPGADRAPAARHAERHRQPRRLALPAPVLPPRGLPPGRLAHPQAPHGAGQRLVPDLRPRSQPVLPGLHAPRQLDRHLAGAAVRVDVADRPPRPAALQLHRHVGARVDPLAGHRRDERRSRDTPAPAAPRQAERPSPPPSAGTSGPRSSRCRPGS